MATTLPEMTRRIDDAFVHTWYEIRPTAIDNILNATPVMAALRSMGCFKSQVGGEYITRTIRYGIKTATAIRKGSVLAQGEDPIETMARWTWRYFASHVQRSLIDDQKNAGTAKIKSLVETKTAAARDALTQKMEGQFLAAEVTDETGDEFQGLNDIIPAFANRATGTFGALARSNAWWVPKYKATTAPIPVNLLDDMKNLYNTIGDNIEPPNLIIFDQGLFETYEDYALDASQIIKDAATKLADLGFTVLRFKGVPIIWTSNMTANNGLFLNTKYIDVVYDPNVWFDSTGWKPIPLQLERIMHIINTMNTVCSSLRRQGRLYTA